MINLLVEPDRILLRGVSDVLGALVYVNRAVKTLETPVNIMDSSTTPPPTMSSLINIQSHASALCMVWLVQSGTDVITYKEEIVVHI